MPKYKQALLCHVCGRFCNSEEKLEEHAKLHSGEKPFSCIFCGKKFCSKPKLEEHTRTHTGEKPHICDECDFRTSRRYCLRVHKRNHEKREIFSCPVCTYKSKRITNTAFHIQTHGVQTCPYCPLKRFPSLVHLKRHILMTSGIKFNSCIFCEYCTMHVNNLNRHMKLAHKCRKVKKSAENKIFVP